MSIAQTTVEAHGGTVSVTSVPGRTEFTVRLPASPPPEQNPGGGEPVERISWIDP